MRAVTALCVLATFTLSVQSSGIPDALPARNPLPPRNNAAGAPDSQALLAAPAQPPDVPSHKGPAASLERDVKDTAVIAPKPPPGPAPLLQTGNLAANAPAEQAPAHPGSGSAVDAAAASSDTAVVAAALGPNACDAGGACAALGEAVVGAAEGPECRQLHITGKCNAKCLTALKEALAHKLWDACATRCETDVVAGAAHRWAELCEQRQPTLIDKSKEALQIVAISHGASRAMKALLILGMLFTAIALSYRRGLLQGTALRLQKRMKRRSSEHNIV